MACYRVNFTFVFLLFLETSQISGKDSFLFNSALLLCSVCLCSTFSLRSRRSVTFIQLCGSPGVACVHTCRSCSLCSRCNESHLLQVVRKYLKALIAFVSFDISPEQSKFGGQQRHYTRVTDRELCAVLQKVGVRRLIFWNHKCQNRVCLHSSLVHGEEALRSWLKKNVCTRHPERERMALYGYPAWGFSVLFSSVVSQMPGYNSQRRGTASTLPN